MNRTYRLLAIVLELQAKGWQRAEDLAAIFEISKRTVYRDMAALSESGVPIVSTPGQGYSLMEGYFLPPLSFSPDEAVILLLGSDLMAQNFDAQYREAAHAASSKIQAVLGEARRAQVRELQESLHFVSARRHDRAVPPEFLQKLRRAIVQRRTIHFEYHSRNTEDIGGSKRWRKADPHALVNWNNQWYLLAFCHAHREIRNFRLERIDALEPTNQTFSRQPGFVVKETTSERSITVRVLFDPAVARWVREELPYFVSDVCDTLDGLLVTLEVRREDDLLRWLLGWGIYVQVLEPDTLRERLIVEAQAVIEKHKLGVG